MFKKTIAAILMTATATTGLIATPAAARDHYRDGYSQRYEGDRYQRGDRYQGYDNRYENRRYDDRRVYRGNDRRYNNRYQCDNGTGGTVVGAVAGGLLGNEVAGRGDKTVGAILGAALGAFAGRAIDKSDDPCRR